MIGMQTSSGLPFLVLHVLIVHIVIDIVVIVSQTLYDYTQYKDGHDHQLHVFLCHARAQYPAANNYFYTKPIIMLYKSNNWRRRSGHMHLTA